MNNATVAVTLTLLAALATQSVEAEPESYTMMCRGGGNMQISIFSNSNRTIVRIYFERGLKPPDEAACGPVSVPGQIAACTWTSQAKSFFNCGMDISTPG